MTLLERTTTASTTSINLEQSAPTSADTAAPAPARLDHPAFGHAHQATVSPVSMELYRVTLAGSILGYLEAAGPIWVALSGELYPRAVEVGQHRLFSAALRLLTDPA
jgi:hypothetical protein